MFRPPAPPAAGLGFPPRQIIPHLNNGSLGVYANPNAANLALFGQPVFSFIAAAPLDVRLLQAGVPVAIDRIIPALSPGQQLQISVPAGQIQMQGPQPIIQQIILSGWGAQRAQQSAMMAQRNAAYQNSLLAQQMYWSSQNSNHNPFPTYTGFFPQQSYSAPTGQSDLYSLHNLATAYNVEQSQMTPNFGNFGGSAASNSTEENPSAASDKDKKSSESKSEK
ncbi:MAG: hypothetical protein JNM56_02905 [Planctomycetia bacterium]|nr:hypothetical protein [Planctomycetia bacterium]